MRISNEQFIQELVKVAVENGYYPSRLGRVYFQKKSYQISVVIQCLH
ncbi:hypothetical protein [Clostridium butyricum]